MAGATYLGSSHEQATNTAQHLVQGVWFRSRLNPALEPVGGFKNDGIFQTRLSTVQFVGGVLLDRRTQPQVLSLPNLHLLHRLQTRRSLARGGRSSRS